MDALPPDAEAFFLLSREAASLSQPHRGAVCDSIIRLMRCPPSILKAEIAALETSIAVTTEPHREPLSAAASKLCYAIKRAADANAFTRFLDEVPETLREAVRATLIGLAKCADAPDEAPEAETP